MHDPGILRINLDHFRRLLEIEADPAKQQRILKLIRETEALLSGMGSREAPLQIWSLQAKLPQKTASRSREAESGRARVTGAWLNPAEPSDVISRPTRVLRSSFT
jgi:hypothetical protein